MSKDEPRVHKAERYDEYHGTLDCKCLIILGGTGEMFIHFCPLHEAAPYLLEALRQALSWLEDAPFDYRNGNTASGIDEGEVYGLRGHIAIVKQITAAIAKAKG